MNDPNPQTPESKFPEWLRMTLILVYTAALLAACVTMPFVVSHYFGRGWAMVATLVAIPTWGYLGPPAMPGLINGIISLTGMAGLIGLFTAAVIRFFTR